MSGKIIEFKDQWHIYAKSSGNATRYLAIVQVKDKHDSSEFQQPAADAQGVFKIGAWTMAVEMNTSNPPSFEIMHNDGEAAIVYGKKEAILDGEKYPAKHFGSTMLIERINGNRMVQEAVDVLPEGRD
jgi:hypothetical protein